MSEQDSLDPGPAYRQFHGSNTSDDESDDGDIAPQHQILPNVTHRKNRWHHIHGMLIKYSLYTH